MSVTDRSSETIRATIPNVATHLDRRTIRFDRRLNAPIERVWEAYTNPDHTAKWWWETEMDLREGGRFDFGWNRGVISDFNPPHTIQWNYGGSDGYTRVELSADGDGTLHTLIDRFPDMTVDFAHQTGGKGTHYPAVIGCWHEGVDGLQEYLEGTVPPIDNEGLIELYCAYVTEDWHRERFGEAAT